MISEDFYLHVVCESNQRLALENTYVFNIDIDIYVRMIFEDFRGFLPADENYAALEHTHSYRYEYEYTHIYIHIHTYTCRYEYE